ncbi:MAG: sugar phosphate nucleotidyltransferase, partial [Coriobacteriia bacterium]|nr:sugar phosphate nucleotidyltransferase [Coriobacteriia bacterium]
PNPQLVQRLEQAGKPGYAQAVAAAGAMPVSYVGQPQPLGLGHAVLCAAPQVLAQTPPEPFYVLLGDVLVPDCQMLPRMLAVSRAHHNASVIAVIAVADEEVSRFGIIGGRPLPGADAVWRIERLVEKPAAADAPSNLAVFGRYLLSPRVMQILPEVRPGAANEIQLTDALVGLLAEEEVYALVVGPDEGYDVGTVASWLETNLRLAARDPQLGPLVEAWKSEAGAPC